MLYQAYRETLVSKPILIPITEKFTPKKDLDYYSSLYYYTDEHKSLYAEKGSLAGIKNTTTNCLYFDFDAKDLENSRKDAITVGTRLVDQYGIDPDAVKVYWTGNKGFALEVELDRFITPEEFKAATFKLASDLESFDTVINDPNRIVRLPNTRHQKSGLYKIQLTPEELGNLSIDEIKGLAKTPRQKLVTSTVKLPEELFTLETLPARINTPQPLDIDFSKKAKGWTNCKWSLLNGNFKPGNRHYPILSIVATSRALNYPKETAYYMAKSASKLSAQRHGGEEFPKEEIWTIVESVYQDNWNGGTFSCKDGKSPWLTEICHGLGPHKCKKDEEKVFSDLEELSQVFTKFSKEIEQNKIKTGIDQLDQNVTLCTSTLVGLLGCPGSGKTSLSLNILNYSSKNNIPCIFFSMDMGIPLVYLKLIQKHYKENLSADQVFEIFKSDPIKSAEINKILEDNYKNVKFSFKSGMTPEDIRENILNHQERTGQKLKLVVVDYLECIRGEFSDQTANTAIIANKLKDIANETETCILLLLQTQKHAGQPDEPLLSMKNIKGSSVIEQACSVILTLWREGYSPKYEGKDNFISIATVKDRFNSLWKQDFKWSGLRGIISELDDIGQEELQELRDRKKAEKATEDGGW